MQISRHLWPFLGPPNVVRSSASSLQFLQFLRVRVSLRFYQAPSRNIPLYQLPDVVLDLDAEDCPYVRPYDDALAAAETARWRQAHASIDALLERLAAFEQDAAQAETRMHAVLNTPSSPWRITDRDLLSVALQGPRTPKSPSAETALQTLFHENGVPTWATREPSKAIHFMMHRQGLAQRRAWAAAAATATATAKRPNAFHTALTRCTSFVALRRLLVLASRSTAGCGALLRSGPAVAEQLQRLAFASQDNVAVLLLNLHHSLADKGLVLDRALWALGLRAVAATMEPAAIRRFLEVGLSAGYLDADTDADTDAVLLDALTAVYAALRETGQRQTQLGTSLAELLAVVVGEDGETASFHVALRRVGGSFRSLSRYHAILAELGAVQTLWAEQQKEGGMVVGVDTLAMAVQRYASYSYSYMAMAERSMQERTDAAQTAAARNGYEGEEEEEEEEDAGWRSDGEMLRAYEAAEQIGEEEAGEAGPRMLRRVMTKLPTMTKLPASSEFREEAAAAFGRTTVYECLTEIGRVVVQHGLSSRVQRASK